MTKSEVREIDGITIIDCIGQITLGLGSSRLRECVGKQVREGKKKIILNLSETGYVDASGIGEIVSGFTQLSNSGAELKLLVKKGGGIESLLQTIKLIPVFEIYHEETEALISFNSRDARLSRTTRETIETLQRLAEEDNTDPWALLEKLIKAEDETRHVEYVPGKGFVRSKCKRQGCSESANAHTGPRYGN